MIRGGGCKVTLTAEENNSAIKKYQEMLRSMSLYGWPRLLCKLWVVYTGLTASTLHAPLARSARRSAFPAASP